MDVERIVLGNDEFEGQNNVYAVAPADGPVTLVDTGAGGYLRDVADGLAAHDIEFADVDQILLTHWHSDHAGLAGEIQAESGATVRAHPDDAPLVEQRPAAWDELRATRERRYDQWGVPPEPRRRLRTFFETHDEYGGRAADVSPVEAGDRVDVGETTLDVLALPGHTAGLVGFGAGETGRRTLFSGDALLPRYTPNVGGADVRVSDPLAVYLETLERIVDGAFARALPGHRDPIDDPTARARAVAVHHRDRMETVVAFLDAHGPADAWTVSAHLFGELDGIHILHGPGEAYAHLAHLESHGLVDRDENRYALRDADPDLAGVFPSALLRDATEPDRE